MTKKVIPRGMSTNILMIEFIELVYLVLSTPSLISLTIDHYSMSQSKEHSADEKNIHFTQEKIA